MQYAIQSIAQQINAQFLNATQKEFLLDTVAFDSRKLSKGNDTLFFALAGIKSDGHQYLTDAYQQGVRNFVVSKKVNAEEYPNANLLLVDNSLAALQALAAYHRSQLNLPILAISGSNGKTTIKEWLAQALASKRNITKTPLSYNSQIGVPYSLLSLNEQADLAIIEAGISVSGEMTKLQSIIKPDIGILTNIGDAHSSGFENKKEKTLEKLKLFKDSQLIIYNKDADAVDKILALAYPHKLVSWGKHRNSNIRIIDQISDADSAEIKLEYGSRNFNFTLPFSNEGHIENTLHIISYLILDGWKNNEIQAAIEKFSPLPNRLEIRRGHNNNLILNDSYSSDQASLELAFAQLAQQAEGRKKIAILSALDQQKDQAAYQQLIQKLCDLHKIEKLVTIGFDINNNPQAYTSTETCLSDHDWHSISDSAILIKGASSYQLHNIAERLTEQVHQTILETNLSAIAHNLNCYRKKLKPETKIMAVIKAQAYGSGSTQLATFLQQQKVDYLGVALIDEAIEIRKSGCQIPIMVFNVQTRNLEELWNYDLEPEVYNLEILEELIRLAKTKTSILKIHLKYDSGMNRLGFDDNAIKSLQELLPAAGLRVHSIFSHLVSSELPEHDSFTQAQAKSFEEACNQLSSHLGYTPFRHLLNSAGTSRFPQFQYELVRIGLGLYGYDEAATPVSELQIAHRLTARVLQTKILEPGESTGYSRAGTVLHKTEIAVISIGYADGLMRLAGNGNCAFQIKGAACPTIGNICMDVCMIILPETGYAKVGDTVVIYGPEHSPNILATACKTITYEIISRISPRVKRTYIHE